MYSLIPQGYAASGGEYVPEEIKDDQFQARQSATKQTAFKTKNLNIWCNAAQPWINMERWDKCFDRSMRIEDFALDPCILAVDLASRKDTVSTVRLFKRSRRTGKIDSESGEEIVEKHYFCFSRHYLNAEQVRDEKHPHFADWAAQGYLIETPGNITDYLKVARDIVDDSDSQVIRELVFDPYHAAPFVQFLTAREDWPGGIEISDLKQTEENMSPAMKELEAAIESHCFHHNGNPVLTWMVGNTRKRLSRKENWYPERENVERKIDGTVAIILGLNRLMQLDVDDEPGGKVQWV